MKMYNFKQAVRVGRQTFPLGIRQVPAEMEKHPHFQQFVKAGSVEVAGAAHVGMKLSDLPTLPPPSSAAAKRSQVAAQAVQEHEVAPEAEIGGDAADPVFPDDEAEAPKKKGKGK